jgi:uncharacterized repeat protein (TIGR01451 family)
MANYTYALIAILAVSATNIEAQSDVLQSSARNLSAERAAERGEARDHALALPGDTIRFALTFNNTTDRSLQDIRIENPIPEGSVYLDSSEDLSTREFSLNHGESYSIQPMITVTVNGETVQRPAPLEQYTAVRWTLRGEIRPGERRVVYLDTVARRQ